VSEFPPPELLEPQWFIPFFALMWFVICGSLALASGWWSLASRFAAPGSVQGECFRFVSGSMGLRFFPVNYGNCLFVTVNDDGFRLAILFVFRFLSPPLYIPWARVESIAEKRFLFIRYASIRIRESWPRLSFYGKAGKGILEAYARALGKRAL
jgi:hypothetical protein